MQNCLNFLQSEAMGTLKHCSCALPLSCALAFLMPKSHQVKLSLLNHVIFTVRNEVAKMFLHVSVCLQGGTWADTPPGKHTTRKHTPPGSTPAPDPDPGRRLTLHTVRILLECILVYQYNFHQKRNVHVCSL